MIKQKEKENLSAKLEVKALVKGNIVKLNFLIAALLALTILSCKQSRDTKCINEINKIVSEFETSEYYSFEPYFKANMSTIIIDSTLALSIKCDGQKIKEKSVIGKFDNREIQLAKETFNFCKRHSIYNITNYPTFSIIETNLCDSTYSDLKKSNPKYFDPDIAFYHVEDPDRAPYKYSIVILKGESKVEEINQLKDKKLISFQDGVYLYRSFINWDNDKFDLFECNW